MALGDQLCSCTDFYIRTNYTKRPYFNTVIKLCAVGHHCCGMNFCHNSLSRVKQFIFAEPSYNIHDYLSVFQ